MPSFYLHQQAALMAADVLTGSSSDKGALALGALGPDTFYYHKLLQPSNANSLRQLGGKLHKLHTNDFLVTLIQLCADEPLLRAYALGFVSHYAADTVFHPFVYAHSFREGTQGSGSARAGDYSPVRHFSLERALDVWLMKLQRGNAQRGTISDLTDDQRSAIARRLSLSCASWDAETAVPIADILQAIKNGNNIIFTAGIAGMLPEKCVTLLARAWGAESIEPMTDSELLSLAETGWRNPWQPGNLSYDGPLDLLGRVIERTRALMLAVLEYWDSRTSETQLRAMLGDLSYLSGIDWRRTGDAVGEML